MAKGLVTGTHLTNIANAIRAKLGVQTTYQPSQMAAAIESIPTGGGAVDLTTGVKFAYSDFTQLPDEIVGANWTSITSARNMFSSCSKLASVSLLDTSELTDMGYMFIGCTKLTAIPQFNTSKATNLQGMLRNCSLITTVPLLDTSSVTDIREMFQSCRALTAVPHFDTSNATAMTSMFYACSNLTTVPQLNTSKATTMSGMFGQCSSLSNESLNNILAMCANATLITNANYKTLKYVGLTSAQALVCEGLSNWSDFLAAGWTSGY